MNKKSINYHLFGNSVLFSSWSKVKICYLRNLVIIRESLEGKFPVLWYDEKLI